MDNKLSSPVLGLPGLFQPRKFDCCLACSLKDAGIPASVVQFFRDQEQTFSELMVKNDWEINLGDLARYFEVVLIIWKGMEERHENKPLLHDFYGQHKILTMATCSVDGLALGNMDFKRGFIYQIYADQDRWNIPNKILFNLAYQCFQPINSSTLYSGFDDLPKDNIVMISSVEGMLYYFSTDAAGNLQVQQWQVLSQDLEDQMEEIYRLLIPEERPALIILNCLCYNLHSNKQNPSDSYVPYAQEWYSFLNAVYGTLEDSIFIMTINKRDCFNFVMNKVEEIKHSVNRNVPLTTRQQTFCLDVPDNQNDATLLKFCLLEKDE